MCVASGETLLPSSISFPSLFGILFPIRNTEQEQLTWKKQHELCNYGNSVTKRVIRREEERKKKKRGRERGEGDRRKRARKNGGTTERKCGEEEQREGIKHRGKQSRRQLSVSRAKIAGQFPPLRACANLFLLRFSLPPSLRSALLFLFLSLLATIFTVASVRRRFCPRPNRPHVRSDYEYTKSP